MIASLVPVASKLLGKFIEDKDTKNKHSPRNIHNG